MRTDLFHAENGQTDVTKLIVAFRMLTHLREEENTETRPCFTA